MLDRKYKGLSETIKEKACSLGFDLCGIAGARILSECGPILQKWCENGMNDRMSFLNRDIDKRINPEMQYPGASSMVVTGLNYYTDRLQRHEDVPVISRYALGKDYHELITGKLLKLLEYIKTVVPDAEGRAFADSAPLTEKPWAVEAGLGWQGKHSIVINEKIGSFFFLGILILNIPLEYDRPYCSEKCGNCRICIDRCPTGAINENRTIDARKCISNLTIENRGPLPAEMIPFLGRRVYGCDCCQEVCPWNKNTTPHNHRELDISDDLAIMKREDWLSLTSEQFGTTFKGTPVERVKFERFKNNIGTILNNQNSK